MFTVFPAATTATPMLPGSRHSSTKKTVVPITSRIAILQNRSTAYKARRRLRGKQLRVLHNDILDNDDEWKVFHNILQEHLSNKSVSNSTVKALLFDALDAFHQKSSETESSLHQESCVIQEDESTTKCCQEHTIETTKENGDDISKPKTVRIRLSVSTGNIMSLKSQQQQIISTKTNPLQEIREVKTISIDKSAPFARCKSYHIMKMEMHLEHDYRNFIVTEEMDLVYYQPSSSDTSMTESLSSNEWTF